MRLHLKIFAGWVLLMCCTWAQSRQNSSAPSSPAAAQKTASQPAAKASATAAKNLESVLTEMDHAAGNFHSAEAMLSSQQYQAVVDETDTQQGPIYFRREGKQLEMKLEVTRPDKKSVLVKDGKAQLYQPAIDQLTEYTLSSGGGDEGMFALGFGGRGHDLTKSFDVQLAGFEKMDGVNTAKLVMTPKNPKVLNMFSRITVWIDPQRDVSLLQQFDEPSGDWRKAHYTEIKLNAHLKDDLFELNTTPKTKVVRP